tara:strand:- start:319 stop:879 length:561 start_codon:yes stop_codon:yes gene_type:complete
MKNHKLIIFDFDLLFNILNEIKEYLSFELVKVSKKDYKILINNYPNSVIIGRQEFKNLKMIIFEKDFPIRISRFNEIINTNFLKKKFISQSNQSIGLYTLDLNSKKIFKNGIFLDLTEKEIKLINFLQQSNKPITTIELQKKVWSYASSLETHTVETHVYRLRKKFLKTFNDDNFIVSNKEGYHIK